VTDPPDGTEDAATPDNPVASVAPSAPSDARPSDDEASVVLPGSKPSADEPSADEPIPAAGDTGVVDAPDPATPDPPAPEADVPEADAAAERTFVVVEVVNVSFDLPSTSPVIHLLEQESPFRSLDFPIGLTEAQSIAYALESEAPPRPNTHDLLVSVLVVARCEVVAVRLTGERGGTILAELDLMGPRGHEVLDCRPTDGIAVALRLRVPAPILCEANLLDR